MAVKTGNFGLGRGKGGHGVQPITFRPISKGKRKNRVFVGVLFSSSSSESSDCIETTPTISRTQGRVGTWKLKQHKGNILEQSVIYFLGGFPFFTHSL